MLWKKDGENRFYVNIVFRASRQAQARHLIKTGQAYFKDLTKILVLKGFWVQIMDFSRLNFGLSVFDLSPTQSLRNYLSIWSVRRKTISDKYY